MTVKLFCGIRMSVQKMPKTLFGRKVFLFLHPILLIAQHFFINVSCFRIPILCFTISNIHSNNNNNNPSHDITMSTSNITTDTGTHVDTPTISSTTEMRTLTDRDHRYVRHAFHLMHSLHCGPLLSNFRVYAIVTFTLPNATKVSTKVGKNASLATGTSVASPQTSVKATLPPSTSTPLAKEDVASSSKPETNSTSLPRENCYYQCGDHAEIPYHYDHSILFAPPSTVSPSSSSFTYFPPDPSIEDKEFTHVRPQRLSDHYTDNGEPVYFITGTNTEICWMGSGVCAERSALLALRQIPYAEILSLYIVSTSLDEPISPGMLCREFCLQFMSDQVPIIMASLTSTAASSASTKYDIVSNASNLPYTYRCATLKEIYPHKPLYLQVSTPFILDYATQKFADSASFPEKHPYYPYYERAIAFTVYDDKDNLHTVKLAGCAIFDDGTVEYANGTKALEFGYSGEPFYKLFHVFEDKKRKNISLVAMFVCDQFGLLHPPIAASRALYSENEGGSISILCHTQENIHQSSEYVNEIAYLGHAKNEGGFHLIQAAFSTFIPDKLDLKDLGK